MKLICLKFNAKRRLYKSDAKNFPGRHSCIGAANFELKSFSKFLTEQQTSDAFSDKWGAYEETSEKKFGIRCKKTGTSDFMDLLRRKNLPISFRLKKLSLMSVAVWDINQNGLRL